jgi:hypothetical protein
MDGQLDAAKLEDNLRKPGGEQRVVESAGESGGTSYSS